MKVFGESTLEERKKISWMDVILLVMIAALIFSIILLSCVPPVSKDALVHHLAVPKLYLLHGGMYEIPHMVFSYFPMNLDLLYLLPLWLGNDMAAKFIHFSFALLTGGLLFLYLKSRMNRTFALLGVLFFLSIPIIVKLSITVYVDLGVIFFSTASMILIFEWVRRGFQWKFLVLSAFSCGLAMGTKYNGLVTFCLLTLFVPFMYSRYHTGKRPAFWEAAGRGVVFFFVSLLVFSPWMVRNSCWKENPVYPLYDHYFNPPAGSQALTDTERAAKAASRGFFTKRRALYGETWWQMALLPFRVFFQGKDGNPQYFDGKLNPMLLVLPLLGFYRSRDDPSSIKTEKKALLAFALLFFGFALFSSVLRIRYIAPIIPPLVILSVFGVKNMTEIAKGWRRRALKKIGWTAVFAVPALFVGLNAHYLIRQFEHVGPLSYLRGELTREEYIQKYVLEYPALKYINTHLPEDSKILFIFLGKRGYYCQRDYILDGGRFHHIIKTSDSPREVLHKIQDLGITHMLIRYDIFDPWLRDPFIFTEKERDLITAFFKRHVEVLFFKWGYGVSRIS